MANKNKWGGGGTLEQLVRSGRFVYVVYTDKFVVEVNLLHPSKEYTMNVRAEGETIEEAVKALWAKLPTELP